MAVVGMTLLHRCHDDQFSFPKSSTEFKTFSLCVANDLHSPSPVSLEVDTHKTDEYQQTQQKEFTQLGCYRPFNVDARPTRIGTSVIIGSDCRAPSIDYHSQQEEIEIQSGRNFLPLFE